MKYIHATQVVLYFHLLNCPQHLRQALARYRGVHAHVVGTDAPGRREGILSAAPKFQTLPLIAAHFDSRVARVLEHLLHSHHLYLHLSPAASPFPQYHSADTTDRATAAVPIP